MWSGIQESRSETSWSLKWQIRCQSARESKGVGTRPAARKNEYRGSSKGMILHSSVQERRSVGMSERSYKRDRGGREESVEGVRVLSLTSGRVPTETSAKRVLEARGTRRAREAGAGTSPSLRAITGQPYAVAAAADQVPARGDGRKSGHAACHWSNSLMMGPHRRRSFVGLKRQEVNEVGRSCSRSVALQGRRCAAAAATSSCPRIKGLHFACSRLLIKSDRSPRYPPAARTFHRAKL